MSGCSVTSVEQKVNALLEAENGIYSMFIFRVMQNAKIV